MGIMTDIFMAANENMREVENKKEKDYLVTSSVDKVISTLTEFFTPVLHDMLNNEINKMIAKGLTMKDIEKEFDKTVTEMDELKQILSKISTELKKEVKDAPTVIATDAPVVVTEKAAPVVASGIPKVAPEAEAATKPILVEGMSIPPIGSGRTWNPGDQHECHA